MNATEARKITDTVTDRQDIELKHIHAAIRKAAEQGLGSVQFYIDISYNTRERLIKQGYDVNYMFSTNVGKVIVISW